MEILHVKHNLNLVAHLEAGAWINTSDKLVTSTHHVQEDFIAHQLGHVHLGLNIGRMDPWRSEYRVVNIFWANAEDDLLADEWEIGVDFAFRHLDARRHHID